MNDDPGVTIRLLRHELDSWRPFTEALRTDERQAFRSLLEKVWRYQEAIESSGKTYLVEPFFLSILLIQEQKIRFLQNELAKLKEEVRSREPAVLAKETAPRAIELTHRQRKSITP